MMLFDTGYVYMHTRSQRIVSNQVKAGNLIIQNPQFTCAKNNRVSPPPPDAPQTVTTADLGAAAFSHMPEHTGQLASCGGGFPKPLCSRGSWTYSQTVGLISAADCGICFFFCVCVCFLIYIYFKYFSKIMLP